MNRKKYLRFILLFILVILFNLPCTLKAQSKTGEIKGQVIDSKAKTVLPGANIRLKGTSFITVSESDGQFELNNIPLGTYTMVVSFVGYTTSDLRVEVSGSSQPPVIVRLSGTTRQLPGVSITALRPDMQPETGLQAESQQEANTRDEGEMMRNLQGVDAVRRGPLGLNPSIRGLRESEIGVYVNGARMFPAGPAGMDSQLSHYNPDDIKSIQVVKGPYALMWGPGNLSAVRVQTSGIPDNPNLGWLHGGLSAGYSTNINSLNTSASLYGGGKEVGYRISGGWRKGNDYTSGNGTVIPDGFLSESLRGEERFRLQPNQTLTLSEGVQDQNNVDYPGRLLNARFFHTYDMSLNYDWVRPGKILRKISINTYGNRIVHRMNNDGKPTSEPNPDRMPPFPLNVVVNCQSRTLGASGILSFRSGSPWQFDLGGNLFSNFRRAERDVSRRDTGMPIFQDLAWPDANVSMGGVFIKTQRNLGNSWLLSALVREDIMVARADSVSDFFRTNVSGNLDHQHMVTSGALSFTYNPSAHWSYSLGLGSATRSPDASELYSDRFPSSRAQMSAEFVGNPELLPETSLQADLWTEAHYQKFSLEIDAFVRHMDHYITIRTTDLPKRLPLSPDTVYQYTNGNANFLGGELSALYRLLPTLRLNAGFTYLQGYNLSLNEPALGVSPFRTDWSLRFSPARGHWFAEGEFHGVSKQDRVARKLGETVTPGYATLGIKAGYIESHWQLFAGVENLTNRQYVNHLNSKDPFNGEAVPEPGRVIYGKLIFSF